MTPEQALQLLDNVVSQMSMSRADHDRVRVAVHVLAAAIAPNEKEGQVAKNGNQEVAKITK